MLRKKGEDRGCVCSDVGYCLQASVGNDLWIGPLSLRSPAVGTLMARLDIDLTLHVSCRADLRNWVLKNDSVAPRDRWRIKFEAQTSWLHPFHEKLSQDLSNDCIVMQISELKTDRRIMFRLLGLLRELRYQIYDTVFEGRYRHKCALY